jgi:hypothetical protein
MIRRHRALFTLFLSLLLLAMQLQAQVHAFGHVGEMQRHTPDHSLVAPVDDACAMCTLLAGGANAIACDASQSWAALVADEAPTCALVSWAPAAPSYYLTRAPPSLL